MPDARLAYRPFAEQVAFFQRKVNIPTERWDDIERGDHAHGFMVAGAARAALLDDLRQAVARAISEGRGFGVFQQEFEAIVARHGWSGWHGEGSAAGRAWRANVIYSTNIRQSYNAGRYQQLTHPDMLAVRPYWEYRHGERGVSKVPRPQHLAWNGLVLRWDDPWWKTHYPSNGWGCNCGVRAHGESDLERRGLAVGTAPEGTGGIDEGFDYNVGEAARSLPAAAAFGQRVMDLPPAWREIALADAQRRHIDWTADWPAFVDRAAAEIAAGAPRPTGTSTPVGFLPAAPLDMLAHGTSLNGRTYAPVQVDTALVASADRAIYHAFRHAKTEGRGDDFVGAIMGAVRDLPRWTSQAGAIMWDPYQRAPALLIARRQADGTYMTLVVRPNYREKRSSDPVAANWVRTMERRTLADLRPLPLLSGELK